MTSTTTTNVTIHNSLVLVRNVPKYSKGTEWFLCKKENKNRIDRYIRCELNNMGGRRFNTNLCPEILVYVNRPRLGEYHIRSEYGRFDFTDMNTVKQFCNYVGTSSPNDSDNGDHYIDTTHYLNTVFGPLCKY
jgi:hypothetical protein